MRAGQQAQARIRDLEEENRALKEEVRQLRGQQDQIARAILDARASAEALRAETVGAGSRGQGGDAPGAGGGPGGAGEIPPKGVGPEGNAQVNGCGAGGKGGGDGAAGG